MPLKNRKMKAKLKNLHSPDVDLDSFWPENLENFGFLLQAMIGPEDQNAEESFNMQVCTPDWLKTHYTESDIVFGRHLRIFFKFPGKQHFEDLTRHAARATLSTKWRGSICYFSGFIPPLQLLERGQG